MILFWVGALVGFVLGMLFTIGMLMWGVDIEWHGQLPPERTPPAEGSDRGEEQK